MTVNDFIKDKEKFEIDDRDGRDGIFCKSDRRNKNFLDIDYSVLLYFISSLLSF